MSSLEFFHGNPGAKAAKQDREAHAAHGRCPSALSDHGLDATTTAITQAAGVGAGTFYLYFPSKEDLIIEVFRDDIRRTWNDAFALVRLDDPIVDQIIGVFSGVTNVHERDPALARLWFRELPYVSPSAQDAANDVVAWAQHRLEALLDAGRARGALDPDVDVAAAGPHVPRSMDRPDDPTALWRDHGDGRH